NYAALVERLDREPASARGEDQRRIDKAHVPSRVAAGELEARRKQHAALLVEGAGQCAISRLVVVVADLSRDADAAFGAIARGLHEDLLRAVAAREIREVRLETAKAARYSRSGLDRNNGKRPPLLDGPPPIRGLREPNHLRDHTRFSATPQSPRRVAGCPSSSRFAGPSLSPHAGRGAG